jgi:hypothetical protein
MYTSDSIHIPAKIISSNYYFSYSLFNALEHAVSNQWTIVNNKFENVQELTVGLISLELDGGNEDKHEGPQHSQCPIQDLNQEPPK